jgi:hypothetical protein
MKTKSYWRGYIDADTKSMYNEERPVVTNERQNPLLHLPPRP